MSDERFELSRRNALIGLGTVGAASAGAGLGTSAYFSDEESFEDNTLEAGELDLFVDYWTSANTEAIDGGTTGSDQNDGGVSAQYVLNDVKPGDSGKLVFCPKVVDNPAWLWAGSTGFTQYENGLTEPEGDVDDTGGDPGAGNGELADNIQVTVAYCEPSDDLDGEPQSPDDFETVRELNNPEDYTLADLLLELQTGYLLDGLEEDDGDWVPTDDGAYPASPDSDTQTGPCLCIDWNVPTAVGNVIQSDSVEFDIGFTAQQSRHNDDPDNPYVDATASADYHNPSGHGNPTNGTLVANVSWSDDTVALRFEFQDDDDGVDFADTSDYPSTNLPVMIDADDNGYTDFQLVWNTNSPSNVDPLASAPFAKREHDNSDGSPGAFVELPADWSAVKSGDSITWGIPRSELGTSFKLSTWGSTGGEGPVVEISTDSDNTPNFTGSSEYVDVSES
jgi:predicted ribosomally synthesized peptide with SipW-like signal peptide